MSNVVAQQLVRDLMLLHEETELRFGHGGEAPTATALALQHLLARMGGGADPEASVVPVVEGAPAASAGTAGATGLDISTVPPSLAALS